MMGVVHYSMNSNVPVEFKTKKIRRIMALLMGA